MSKMPLTRVQSALGLILALKDGGLEDELKKLETIEVANAEAMGRAEAAQKEADKAMADALDLKAEYESLLKLTNELKAEVEAKEHRLIHQTSELNKAKKDFADESEKAKAKYESDQAELKKKLTAAQRAKSAAEKHEAASLKVRAELEEREARLKKAME